MVTSEPDINPTICKDWGSGGGIALDSWYPLSMSNTPRTSIVFGAGLVAAMVMLCLVCLQGCKVGYTDPDAAGNREAGIIIPLGSIADATNTGIGTVFDAFGGWVGLSGLGGVGAVVAGITRSWAKARSEAAARAARYEEHRNTWDEATTAATLAGRAGNLGGANAGNGGAGGVAEERS